MDSPPDIWVSFHIGDLTTQRGRKAAVVFEDRAFNFGHIPQDEEYLPESFVIKLHNVNVRDESEINEAVEELSGPEAAPPTFWIVVRDTPLLRSKLQDTARQWHETSAGIFIRLQRVTERELDRVVKEFNEPSLALYWIEVAEDNLDQYSKVAIRAQAASLSGPINAGRGLLNKTYLFGLSTPVGEDPTEEASRTLRILAGQSQAIPIPVPLRKMHSMVISDTSELDGMSAGAGAALSAMRGLGDELGYDTHGYNVFQLIRLYLLHLSTVQIKNFPSMTGTETLRWLIDHWHLGDNGCAFALSERVNKRQESPPSGPPSRAALRWQPEPGRDGIAAQSSMLADGSKVTLVHSESTGQTALFHGQEAVATGSNQSMLGRAAKLAERARSGGLR